MAPLFILQDFVAHWLKLMGFHFISRLCSLGMLQQCHFFSQGFQPPMLIFVQSKDRAKELFHELIYDSINVDVIHSDRTQAQVS